MHYQHTSLPASFWSFYMLLYQLFLLLLVILSSSTGFVNIFGPSELPHHFQLLMGSHEKLVAARNVCNEKFGTSTRCFYQSASMLMAMGVNQAEASSETSTTESMANPRNHAIMHAERDNDGEKMTFTFIDFLGKARGFKVDQLKLCVLGKWAHRPCTENPKRM